MCGCSQLYSNEYNCTPSYTTTRGGSCQKAYKSLRRTIISRNGRGRLEIDNNRAERSIKLFVIGRKNWLFANTPSGAKASAIAFSVIETARGNGLDPYKYLKYVFTKAPNLKDNESIDILLPWNVPDDYHKNRYPQLNKLS